MNYFKFKTVAKELNKRKQNRNIKKRREAQQLTWRLPVQPSRPSSCAAQPISTPPLSSSSLPGGRACARRARPRAPATSSLPACLAPPRRPGDATRLPDPLSLLPHSLWISPLPLLSPLRAAADIARNHRGHRPPLTLSISPEEPPSSPASSTPARSTAGALHRRPRRLPHLWCPEIAAVNSPSQKLPRARRPLRSIHCEPLFLFPLLSSSRSSPSFFLHRGRELLAAGHGVAVATATAARSRAHRRAHRDLRSP